MQTQAAIRSDAFRVVPNSRPLPPAARPAYRNRGEANSLDESLQLMGATMAYPRNTEIFGEKRAGPTTFTRSSPAACGPTTSSATAAARSAASTCPAIFSASNSTARHSSAAEAISGREGAGHQAQRARRAGRTRCVGRPRALCADRAGTAAGARPYPAAHQERARARRGISSRNGAPRRRRQCIDLPMSRQDIADYLGLTIETVSRTLTSLGNRGNDRRADVAAHRAAQSLGADPHERLSSGAGQ